MTSERCHRKAGSYSKRFASASLGRSCLENLLFPGAVAISANRVQRQMILLVTFVWHLHVSGRAVKFGQELIWHFRIPAARFGLVCVPLQVQKFLLLRPP